MKQSQSHGGMKHSAIRDFSSIFDDSLSLILLIHSYCILLHMTAETATGNAKIIHSHRPRRLYCIPSTSKENSEKHLDWPLHIMLYALSLIWFCWRYFVCLFVFEESIGNGMKGQVKSTVLAIFMQHKLELSERKEP